MEIIFELAILVGTLVFVGYPLFSDKYKSFQLEGNQMDNYQKLLSNKDMTLSALKDLEFDFLTGKLSESDFNELKSQYELEAVDILKDIDSYKVEGKKTAGAGRPAAKELKVCPACNKSYTNNDKFCSNCGNHL